MAPTDTFAQSCILDDVQTPFTVRQGLTDGKYYNLQAGHARRALTVLRQLINPEAPELPAVLNSAFWLIIDPESTPTVKIELDQHTYELFFDGVYMDELLLQNWLMKEFGFQLWIEKDFSSWRKTMEYLGGDFVAIRQFNGGRRWVVFYCDGRQPNRVFDFTVDLPALPWAKNFDCYSVEQARKRAWGMARSIAGKSYATVLEM